MILKGSSANCDNEKVETRIVTLKESAKKVELMVSSG